MFLHKTLVWRALALACLMATTVAAERLAADDEKALVSTSKPARPTDLRAKATSTTEAALTWADNATDEWEFHLEIRTPDTAWRDFGALPPNATYMTLSNLVPAKTYFFRLRAKNGAGWSAYSNESAATGFYTTPPSCTAGSDVMCLGDGRYRVQTTYERGSDLRGTGRAIEISEESGLFWFFSATNVEAIVKVLDGCDLNNHRWVFTTGLTDLRVVVLIVDTQTGETATYVSEGGSAFAPVTDTEALSCD